VDGAWPVRNLRAAESSATPLRVWRRCPGAGTANHSHHLGGAMRSVSRLILTPAVALALGACSDPQRSPTELAATGGPAFDAAQPWGPETPKFNLEVVLRGDGFGLVKFRQPNDADKIVYLDTWVRDLAPNTSYLLQRAVDTNVNDDCTSSAWLTLGKGTTPQAIVTDDRGTAREALFRNLGATLPGTKFDIH